MCENFILLGLSYISGIIIPGPSLYQIFRASLLHGRLVGLYTAFGVVVGIGIQTIIVLKAVYLLTENALNILKIISAVFLVMLGLIIIFKKSNSNKVSDINKVKNTFFIQGLVIELLNPLAFVFLMSILSLSNIVYSGFMVKIMYLIEILILGLLWFGSVAILATSENFTSSISRFSCQLEKIAGTVLLCFGASSIKTFL